MSLNFYFDLCALIIGITLIFADIFKKTIYGHTNKLFFIELFIVTFAAFFKTGYQLILSGSEFSGPARTFAYIFIYLYLIFQNCIMPMACFYTFSAMGITNIVRRKVFYKISMAFFELIPFFILVVNLFTKRFFFISGAMEYYETPVMNLTYISYLGVLVLGTGVLLFHKKSLKNVKISLSIFVLFLNMAGLLCVIFLPQFKAQLFVVTMSCYLVLLFAQRPELLINSVTGAGSENSFWNEIAVSLKLHRSTNVILLKIRNHKNLHLFFGQEKYNAYLKDITDHIYRILGHNLLFKKMKVYYLGDSVFALTTEINAKLTLQFVAETMQRSFSGKRNFEDFEFFPETCVCIVNVPVDIDNIEYFKYFAKEFHRIIGKSNDAVWIHEEASTEQFKMKNEVDRILTDAFEQGHFEVFYQPIWGVKEKRFVSAEALIRLNDPVYGYVPPSIFIPIAESNGLIHKIGDFVFEDVCRFIASQDFKKLGLKYIEINLSASQIVASNLVDKILSVINAWGVTPEQLRLEITENSADFNPVMVEQNIKELHDIGIRFALDDYGTGYSNIKKVTNLPLDVVKLDKSFVDEMQKPVMWTVIQDTIHMLRKLNMEVMVEGVESLETADTFSALRSDGQTACEYLQGYYFSKPLPKKDFVELLNKA